jgi:hypothetical protein
MGRVKSDERVRRGKDQSPAECCQARSMQRIIPKHIAAAGMSCVLCCSAAAARADDAGPSAESVFDGQWSLEFRNASQPGGTFAQTTAYDTTQNMLFTASKNRFRVDKNGTFAWIERDNPFFHADSFYAYKNGTTASLSWDQEAVLKVTG